MWVPPALNPGLLEWVKRRYSRVVSYEEPPVTCYMVDGHTLLRNKPAEVFSTDQLQRYVAGVVQGLLTDPNRTLQCVVLFFDRPAHPRQLEVHQGDPLAVRRLQQRDNVPECTFTNEDDGSYLHIGSNDRLPDPWLDYLSNPRLVAHEVLPLVANAFIDPSMFQIPLGKSLVFWGLPLVPDPDMRTPDFVQGMTCEYVRPTGILNDRLVSRDERIWNRVGVFQAFAHPAHPERAWRIYDMWSWDAPIRDSLMVPVHLHRLMRHPTAVFSDNSEHLPVLLAYCRDKTPNSNPVYLRLRSRVPPASDDDYFDVCKLFEMIQVDEGTFGRFVQNRWLAFVFCLLLGGTSLFPASRALPGITDKTALLRTFLAHQETFSHLVQLSTVLVRDDRELREPALDEECFRDFVLQCHWDQAPQHPPLDSPAAMQAFLEDPEPQETPAVPSPEAIRRWGRWAAYNLEYWLNGHRSADAFLPHGPFSALMTVSSLGWAPPTQESAQAPRMPFYGFAWDADARSLVHAPRLIPFERPVFECYARNFLRARKHRRDPRDKPSAEQENKRRKVLRAIQQHLL